MLVRFEMPRNFEDLLGDFLQTEMVPSHAAFPPIDIAEYENESVIVAELPGVKKEDVKLTTENGFLTISGERKPYTIPQDARVLLNEMQVKNFTRTVRFPHAVDVNKISAELQSGVLRIVLPKTEEDLVRTVEVK